jgi:hypothetical protein
LYLLIVKSVKLRNVGELQIPITNSQGNTKAKIMFIETHIGVVEYDTPPYNDIDSLHSE